MNSTLYFLSGVEPSCKIDLELPIGETIKTEQLPLEHSNGLVTLDNTKFQENLANLNIVIKSKDFGSVDYGEEEPEIHVKNELDDMKLENQELNIKEEDEEGIVM